MSEANFWKEIKPNVKKHGHWSRIESHATADGFPDTVFTIKGKEGKIELKHVKIGKKLEVRPSQVRWFRRNVRNGGNPWLFIKWERKAKEPVYFLAHGYLVEGMHDKSLDFWLEVNIFRWESKVNWDEFIRYICS